MKIKAVELKGFRGYSQPIRIVFSDLLVLVGRNDIGKSTILEALDVFFNEGKGCIKLDKDDINKQCLVQGDNCIEVSVEFDELPDSILIDSTNETTLGDEYLLTQDGTLKVIKRYPNAGKEKVYIAAHHPTAPGCSELLQKKNSELKKILDGQSLDCPDKTKNSELRKSIWNGQSELNLEDIEIEVAKIDAKNIWDQLKTCMPLFTLFQSDRKNSDGDNEVQDPMRLAVREILGDPKIKKELAKVADTVKSRLDAVAAQTLTKLSEMNPDIASSLNPRIPDSSVLKWGDVFKSVAISSDDDIPINKRGSGVKRLILISFFRAEAERRQIESGLPSVVYGIEEPETAQHPDHQRALIDAMIALSGADKTQIVLTTHSPEVVKRLRFDDIVLIAGQSPSEVNKIVEGELPYPSLNEVNFAAFGESSYEYHIELYGYIEAEGAMTQYRENMPTMRYKKQMKNGDEREMQLVLSEYVRHQIHHPDNALNRRFSTDELKKSIEQMRTFIRSRL